MLINMSQMLSVAKEKHFAVGAFNVSESNLFRTVVEAAEANDAPAIIAVHPTELAYCKDDFVKYMIARCGNSPVPFVIHMDHGDSIESIMRAIHVGFTSVMIDGSALPFEENMRRSVEAGINKINVGTDYMIAQREFIAKSLAENPSYDFPTLVEDSWAAGRAVIKRYIEISGSAGKAR